MRGIYICDSGSGFRAEATHSGNISRIESVTGETLTELFENILQLYSEEEYGNMVLEFLESEVSRYTLRWEVKETKLSMAEDGDPYYRLTLMPDGNDIPKILEGTNPLEIYEDILWLRYIIPFRTKKDPYDNR